MPTYRARTRLQADSTQRSQHVIRNVLGVNASTTLVTRVRQAGRLKPFFAVNQRGLRNTELLTIARLDRPR